MSAPSTIFEQNQSLAKQINAEALANPHSPYAGKFIGIANGQVVSQADDLDEALRALKSVENDPERIFCFEAGVDYDEVQYIWGVH